MHTYDNHITCTHKNRKTKRQGETVKTKTDIPTNQIMLTYRHFTKKKRVKF